MKFFGQYISTEVEVKVVYYDPVTTDCVFIQRHMR